MGDLISLFDYKEKQVRVVMLDGDPWWVVKDVTDILELNRGTKSIERLEKDEVRLTSITDSLGRVQETYVTNEPGLYSLILGSRKQEAKEFKRWITHDVLPEIRKTGRYRGNNLEQIQNQYNMPKSMPEAYRKIAGLLELNQELVPKAAKFDTFMNGENYQTMNEVAKSLNFGRNKLFRILRNHHIFTKQNLAYQEYINKGYFKVIEVPIKMGNEVVNVSQTLVNAKGIEFIYNFLLKMGFIEKREVQVG